MGLLKSLRKARVKAKAEIKAAKVRAKQEAKNSAKLAARRELLLARAEKDLLKADRKHLKLKHKYADKQAKRELQKLREQRPDKQMARLLGSLRLALPVLIPLAYRGVTAAREAMLKRRSAQLGVSIDQLSQFSGYGAPIKARIAGISDNVHNSSLPKGFILDVDERLKELTAAVDNAEYMTVDQRFRAHRTINRDLDSLAEEIQRKLAS